jgi:hypothetical protein
MHVVTVMGAKTVLFGKIKIETGRLPTALLKEASVGVEEIWLASGRWAEVC